MNVRKFFDLLRVYPDWDKDITIENTETKTLEDIADIVCDERNGNLIIVKKEQDTAAETTEKPEEPEVLAEVKWTKEDIKQSFIKCYGREPTEDELYKCIDEVQWGLIQDVMIEDGWTIIDTAVANVEVSNDE